MPVMKHQCVDDSTRFTKVYLLKRITEITQVVDILRNLVKNQFGVTIKRFRSEDADDYFNKTLANVFDHSRMELPRERCASNISLGLNICGLKLF